MPRARNIKPGFFENEDLAELPAHARLLFIRLWQLADREGRLEDRPKRIKASAFPYEDIDCEPLLQALSYKSFILQYCVDDTDYIQIVNFKKHQNPHIKEPASTIPAPDLHHTSTILAPDLHSASTVQTPDQHHESTEVARRDPESPLLNPERDILNPESKNEEISNSAELPPPKKNRRNGKSKKAEEVIDTEKGNLFEIVTSVEKALGYDKYENREIAFRHARDALKRNPTLTADELAGCAKWMVESDGTFWGNQTVQIASIVKQLPAYRKARKNDFKPPGDQTITSKYFTGEYGRLVKH